MIGALTKELHSEHPSGGQWSAHKSISIVFIKYAPLSGVFENGNVLPALAKKIPNLLSVTRISVIFWWVPAPKVVGTKLYN